MKRKVTLKQIAKELDVSISTVSKSLKKQFGNRKTQDLSSGIRQIL
jgi:predicted transcriptional regulator